MNKDIVFSDLQLARRLEIAEGQACAQFAEARRSLFANSGAEWIESDGALAVFDGVDSPVTQSFGIGILQELSAAGLDRIERFFLERQAPVQHELSPLAGMATLELLSGRSYRPIEQSNVLYRTIEMPPAEDNSRITIRLVAEKDRQIWAEVNASGWTKEHPELEEFLLEIGAISSARRNCSCFLAEYDGVPGAAGALCLHEGVALLGGAATIPELRRRGLQAALLRERMRYAFEQGCDLAMMVAEPGSNSQRNAERNGFRIAYTRTKWKLSMELTAS